MAIGLAAASCGGGGGQWVDTEVDDCADHTNDPQALATAEEWVFPQMCEGVGKSYAGEWRCPAGTVEVKCS